MRDPIDSPPPATIRDLAEGCVRLVHGRTGVMLDFTPETLPLLDHYLREVPKDKPEGEALAVISAGAYFGEVARLNLAGEPRWHEAEDEWSRYRIELDAAFFWFNPMGFALSAVRGEDTEGWGASLGLIDEDREDVERAVGALGEVRDEDYYRLAVRFEVLSLAADVVVARSLGQKLPRHFGPDVYRALIDAEIDGAKKRADELS